MAVNEYWLPDEDRTVYEQFNNDRPTGPQIRTSGSLAEARWPQAYARAAQELGSVDPSEILFLGSAHATVEDNYLLTQLADAMGADAPQYIPHVEPGAGDDWLITDDKTPNANGCERLGIRAVDEQMVQSKLDAGEIKLVYVLEDDPVAAGLFTEKQLKDVHVVLHYYNTTNQTLPVADVALPAAMVVETVGTYVNQDGRAQRVRPAKEIRGINRTLMMEMGKTRQDTHGTPFDKWYNEEHRVNCKPSWELLPEIAERVGHPMDYAKGPKEVMAHVQSTVDAFEGATYDAMGLKGVQLEDISTGETV
jgi:NADH-quinone oxidoreductase subunit G